MTEVWRPVVGYEGLYEVSDQGRVKSLPRKYAGERILKQSLRARYKSVCLCQGNKTKSFTVHSLVTAAFLGPRPNGMCVLHGPNGANDNSLANLSYGTQQQNHHDKWRDGTAQAGETHGQSKLTNNDVIEIRKLANTMSQRSIAAKLGVHQATVFRVIHRRTWTHLPSQEC